MKSSYTSKSARVRLHCICKTIFLFRDFWLQMHHKNTMFMALFLCTWLISPWWLYYTSYTSSSMISSLVQNKMAAPQFLLFPVCQYLQLSFYSYMYSAFLLAFSHQKCKNQVCLAIYFLWSSFGDIIERSRSNNLKRRNFLSNTLHR